MNLPTINELFDELCGEHLSSVVFVQNYLQLFFDGPGINVTNPLTVETAERKITSWAPGFRDLLCSEITKRVQSTEFIEGLRLDIVFEDGSCISISLKQEDYTSPEAIYAHGFKNKGWYAI